MLQVALPGVFGGFGAWKGNLFVGSLMTGRIGRTGHLERIVFNDDGEEIRRGWMVSTAPGGPKCQGQSCPPAGAHTTRIPLASYVPPGVSLWRSEPRR